MNFEIATLDTPWTLPGKISLLLEAKNDSDGPLPASEVMISATALWDAGVVAEVPGLAAGQEWSSVITYPMRRGARLYDAPSSINIEAGGAEFHFALPPGLYSGSLLGLQPKAKKESRFRAVLFGPPGCGKSTFVNTALTALDVQGKRHPRAPTMSNMEHVTLGVDPYLLGDSLVVLDAKGAKSVDGWTLDDVHALLAGQIPDSVPLDEFRNMRGAEREAAIKKASGMPADCIVFCIPLSYLANATPQVRTEVAYFKGLIADLHEHRPFLLVLQCDQDHDELKASKFRRSPTTAGAMAGIVTSAVEVFGVPQDRVLVGVNDTEGDATFDAKLHALGLLQNVVHQCQDADELRAAQQGLR